MKIQLRLGMALTLGGLAAASWSYRASAQVGAVGPVPFVADAQFNALNAANAINSGGAQQIRMPDQGTWAEVVNVTSRWMVVQNQLGQQFPIASDRVRQFMIRWPLTVDRISPASLVEVTGPEGGSNTVIADHVDVYESDAQSLVSPTFSSSFGNNRTIDPIVVDQVNTYGSNPYMAPEEYSLPNRVHIVGRPLGGGENIRLSAGGMNWYTVQPSVNGMSVTQVSLGSNSYARKGDLVYLVPEALSPRSLDVSQLVLYKKIPMRAYQP